MVDKTKKSNNIYVILVILQQQDIPTIFFVITLTRYAVISV